MAIALLGVVHERTDPVVALRIVFGMCLIIVFLAAQSLS
jgi:hypothetical protein